jgi:hypothetical protein
VSFPSCGCGHWCGFSPLAPLLLLPAPLPLLLPPQLLLLPTLLPLLLLSRTS